MSVVMKHEVTITSKPSACGQPTHRDLAATCSCGWSHESNHGSREAISKAVLYHRIAALEAAVGLTFIQTGKGV